MSDLNSNTGFENDFEPTPAEELATTAPEILGVGEVIEVPQPEEDDFFAENAVEAVPDVDPATIVTLIPSSADSKYVTIAGPTQVLELINKAGLRFEGEFTCFLGQNELKLNDLVPGGSTVTIAGKVKGG
jgi:hypothetical protein